MLNHLINNHDSVAFTNDNQHMFSSYEDGRVVAWQQANVNNNHNAVLRRRHPSNKQLIFIPQL